MADAIKIKTPLTEEMIRRLKTGDRVLLSGTVYTARDMAHKRLARAIRNGSVLPFDLTGQIIYYTGPAPAKPGYPIGPAGPTTSYRMDAYTPLLLEYGLKGMIGKGPRDRQVVRAIRRYKAVYFAAVGGVAALLSRCIRKAEVIAYEDLGPEAIRVLEVKDFPLIVVNDARGNDLYKRGLKK